MQMQKRNFKPFEETRVKQIAFNIASGLKNLHDRRIFHRDIKPTNIFMSSTEETAIPVIADFGCSIRLKPGQMMDKLCGTIGYTAPEILLCQPYSFPSDIWSFGVLIYALCFGQLPFNELFVKLSRKNADDYR